MPRTIFCAGCGKEVQSHLVICPVCAMPLPECGAEQAQQPPAPPRRTESRPAATPPAPTDYQPPYGWMDAHETPKPVTRSPVRQDYLPPQVGASSTLPCSSCGETVLRTNRFCPQCGRPQPQALQASPYQPPPRPVREAPAPPSSGRTSGEYPLIVIIARLAALIILANSC